MKKTTIQEKYNTISKSGQNHLKHKPSSTIDKLNIDLNVDNYTINDMKLFIRLPVDEYYDYYKLQQKVEEKIKAISKLNLNLEEKSKIIDFIKRIKFSLKDKLNVKGDNHLAGITDESYSITDLQQDMKKLASVVQDRKEKELESIYVSPINSGLVNDLKRNIITSQLSIDTKFRRNYFSTKSTDFNINLATPLKNVVSMKMSSMEIANIQHVISHSLGTNGFKITKTSTTGAATLSTTVRIDSGNYDTLTLESNILGVSTNKNSLSYVECNIVINPITMRATISGNNDGDRLEIDFGNLVHQNAPPMKTLGWLLGFRKKIYTGQQSYTGEGTVDLAGCKYIFLCVNDFKNTTQDVCTILYENSFLRKHILARIPMREGKGAVLFDDPSDKITKKRHYFGPVNIDKLHIQLIDEYGMEIDMNYNDYSFALEFDILYEK
jgi:hypothetical protein